MTIIEHLEPDPAPESVKDFKLCQIIEPIPLIGPMICNKPTEGEPDNTPAGLFNNLIKGTPLEEPKKNIDKSFDGTLLEGIDSFYVLLGIIIFIISFIIFLVILSMILNKKKPKNKIMQLYNFPIPPPPPPPPINFRLSDEFQ